jgi:hypothetical protein
MLKPIPQEQPGNASPDRGRTAAARRKKPAQKQAHFMRLEMNIRRLEQMERNIVEHAGRQLMDYIRKAENVTLKELNELIHNLQRTVIGLQKKRIRLVRKQQRKKKRR